MGRLQGGTGTLGQWARGGLVAGIVVLMAAASSGALGTPAWATIARPELSAQQADNSDTDNDDDGPSITLNVNSTLDEVDASPGDGTCASAANRCTLRAAVMEANLRGGRHTINVPAGTYVLTIPTSSVPGDNGEPDDASAAMGDLNIQTDIQIIGSSQANTIVDGNASMRIFSLESGRSAKFRQLTLQNGKSTEPGGGIYSQGDLNLNSVTVTGNISTDEGGGIFTSRLNIENSSITNNSASHGGGIYASSVDINNSAVSGNTAVLQGGGLRVSNGNILGSTIAGNSVSASNGQGGGIWSASNIIMDSSAVSANSSAVGAGLWNASRVTVTNSTMSGNASTGNGTSTGLGGGLYFNGSPGDSILINVTVANNAAPRGSGIYKGSGTLQIKNTIVATNTGSADCFRAGSIISQGNNLDGGTGCGFISAGDRQSTNPTIAALGDNGGPTRTHALQAGSPAIDGGTNTNCPSVDQRGIERPRDGNNDNLFVCDIGAFEAPGALAPTPPDNTDTPDNNGTPEPPNPDNQDGSGDNNGPPGTPGQTTVDYMACPGTTSVYVRTLTGFAIGQTIRINAGGPTQEDARVVDVGCNGRYLHLAGSLQFRHQLGEPIVIVSQAAGASSTNTVNQSNDSDQERTQSQRRTEEQRQQSEQTNRSGRDDLHTEGDVSAVDMSKQPPEITILTRDGPQIVQLQCGDQCPTVRVGDYVEVDGTKQNEGLFYAETVTISKR